MKLPPHGSGASDPARLHEAAQALEAMMLKQIISSSGAFHGNGMAGSSIRADLFADAMAQAVAKGGGLGLAAELERSLGGRAAAPSPAPSPPPLPGAGAAAATSLAALPDEDQDGVSDLTGGPDAVPATPAPPSGAGHPATAAPLVGPTRVTSAYGLRADPWSGAVRPHRGVDLAAAEGSTVQAAVAGAVKSVGSRQGYGKTVEIESRDGLTTLYAHASELLVREGDRVEAGQPIARVGHTGRATGPHLHFEARQGGRAIDPSRFLKAYAKRDD